MNRQTFHAKNHEVERRWVHFDASGEQLGRLSARIARILMGKTKPEYTPHHDVGDFVVVTNIDKIEVKGSKVDKKFYTTYSGYPGGQKQYSTRWMLENRPERLLERSVRGMLPRTRLGRAQLKKLKVYRGAEHPHAAQQPVSAR